MAQHLLIEGRVQGVGYRASFADEAARLGLVGWVRNLRNGAVEACIDGDPAAIEAMLEWARRGPPASHVSRVTVGEAPRPGPGFRILSTQ